MYIAQRVHVVTRETLVRIGLISEGNSVAGDLLMLYAVDPSGVVNSNRAMAVGVTFGTNTEFH